MNLKWLVDLIQAAFFIIGTAVVIGFMVGVGWYFLIVGANTY